MRDQESAIFACSTTSLNQQAKAAAKEKITASSALRGFLDHRDPLRSTR
jgi:hypothetical protein